MGARYGYGGRNLQPRHRQLFLAPEQCLGCIAMRGSGMQMFPDTFYLCFELCNPHYKFILRIGAEIFGRQQACGIASRARTLVVNHR